MDTREQKYSTYEDMVERVEAKESGMMDFENAAPSQKTVVQI